MRHHAKSCLDLPARASRKPHSGLQVGTNRIGKHMLQKEDEDQLDQANNVVTYALCLEVFGPRSLVGRSGRLILPSNLGV
jgi:hypothetical protein